ncbi:STAS domain-containing protein [Sphaerisporangium dianthi]|uniref:Anti-sigma factor antagonist n=1 Tax=Sphaerisporangium dianthi TaxID=1436120 RepID=A0ABV9C8C1_9ACTN
MDLSVTVSADAIVCRVSGDVDIASSSALRERLVGLLRLPNPRLVVELSQVSFMDASGVAALLAARRRSLLLGGELRLAEPSSPVRRVLEASGLGSRFEPEPKRGPWPLTDHRAETAPAAPH